MCIDTCTNVCSIAVVTPKLDILSERLYNYKLRHSEILIPEIESMLKELGFSMEEMTRVYVTNGPGSFTGIRIGVTVANTISQVRNIPVYSVCLLDLLVESFRFLDGVILSVIYARANQYFYAFYHISNHQIERTSDYKMGDIDEIAQRINEIDKQVFISGEFLEEHKQKLGQNVGFSSGHSRMPRASVLPFVDILNGSMQTNGYVVPFYLEKSQAEKNLEKQRNE